MSVDGAKDYRGYTTVELREALSTIDRTRFPQNFAALGKELATRAAISQPAAHSDHKHEAAAATPNQSVSPRTKRPALVWVLLVLYAIAVFAGGPIVIAVTTGALDIPGPIGSYYRAFGLWDFVRVGISYLLIAAVLVALFKMSRIALYLAAAAWLYGVLMEIYKFEDMKVLGLTATGMVVGNVLGLGILLYFWHLKHTHRLS